MLEQRGHSTEQETLGAESQFGDKRGIETALETGNARVLGSIEELYPETTPAHKNLVQMVELLRRPSEFSRHHGVHSPVVVESQTGQSLLAIFKPLSGEDTEVRKESGLDSFYGRERAAYLISEHFAFDFVPPTVIREINNEIGSLQLFLPPDEYRVVNDDAIIDEHWEAILESPDYQKLALFDAITANVDRHDNNFMVRVQSEEKALSLDDQGQPELAAIDHGLILATDCYLRKDTHLRGPILRMTYDNKTEHPRSSPIPPELREKLRDGLARRQELDLSSLPDINSQEIDRMWERAQEMVEQGVYISKYNRGR